LFRHNKKNTNLLDSTPRVFKTSPLYTVFCYFQSPILIIDNIYLGNMYCAINEEQLKKMKISYIVNCTQDIHNFYNDSIIYHRINIDDNGKDKMEMDMIEDGIKFIEDAQSLQSTSCKNTYILVQCSAGRSRSVSFLICYLINKHKYTPEDAMLYIKGKKSHINPSKKLFEDCKEYYSKCNSK